MSTSAVVQSDRLLAAAARILQAAPERQLNIVNLNKALFYLDLLYLAERGSTFTEAPYVRLDKGPVVDGYKLKLVQRLVETGIAEQTESPTNPAKPVRLITLETVQLADDLANALAEHVAVEFASVTSTRASSYSHNNPAWLFSGHQQRIDMNIALQQLVHDEDWDEDEDEEKLKRIAQEPCESVSTW